MSPNEIRFLDQLLEMVEDEDDALREKDCDFIVSLDRYYRQKDMSPKQAEYFDDLVRRHLK